MSNSEKPKQIFNRSCYKYVFIVFITLAISILMIIHQDSIRNVFIFERPLTQNTFTQTVDTQYDVNMEELFKIEMVADIYQNTNEQYIYKISNDKIQIEYQTNEQLTWVNEHSMIEGQFMYYQIKSINDTFPIFNTPWLTYEYYNIPSLDIKKGQLLSEYFLDSTQMKPAYEKYLEAYRPSILSVFFATIITFAIIIIVLLIGGKVFLTVLYSKNTNKDL